MRRSQLFQKTLKEVSQTEVSRNAQLLLRAGFVHQLMAGVYSYLPMGLRVLTKIENIVREEMNALGAQEILMPALQPREIWDQTGRWDAIDVLFKLKGAGDRDLALGPTHEEVVTPLAMSVINSYKDMPVAVYQLQTKFRNEARAKSGILRGREFRMKDMYAFHASQAEQDRFYERATEAYMNVYRRCGLGDKTLITFASGGSFSKYSHEFQTITDAGEDIVYKIPGTNQAINKEIIEDKEALNDILPNYKVGDEEKLEQFKTVEVGNIFKLGTKFSQACGLFYGDSNGTQKLPIMSCYGIGPSRLMGTVVECLSDDKGIIWPEEIAPYRVGIVNIRQKDEACVDMAEKLYTMLQTAHAEVLYDDRDLSGGAKQAEMELMGLPWYAIIGPKSAAEGQIEWKNRTNGSITLLPLGLFPW